MGIELFQFRNSVAPQGFNFYIHGDLNQMGIQREYLQTQPKARIVLVNVPYSKLNRGGPGMGYSAYADKIYSEYKTIESVKPRIERHQEALDALKEEYETKVKAVEEGYQADCLLLKNAENNLAIL